MAVETPVSTLAPGSEGIRRDDRRHEIRLVVILAALCLLVFFFRLGARPLWDTDEGMHAATAKDMVLTGARPPIRLLSFGRIALLLVESRCLLQKVAQQGMIDMLPVAELQVAHLLAPALQHVVGIIQIGTTPETKIHCLAKGLDVGDRTIEFVDWLFPLEAFFSSWKSLFHNATQISDDLGLPRLQRRDIIIHLRRTHTAARPGQVKNLCTV